MKNQRLFGRLLLRNSLFPIKFAKKYSNEHERDIDTHSEKKAKKSLAKKEIVIGEVAEEKRKHDDEGIE